MGKYPDLIPQLRQERFQVAIIQELIEINKKLDKLVSQKATTKRTVKKDNEVK